MIYYVYRGWDGPYLHSTRADSLAEAFERAKMVYGRGVVVSEREFDFSGPRITYLTPGLHLTLAESQRNGEEAEHGG